MTQLLPPYILLRHNRVIANGKVLFEKQDVSAPDFLVAAYTHFGMNYPKFFKMDNLCKTGFIAAELLLRDRPLLQNYTPEEKGIMLSTANSSLDTDLRYQATIASAPSPGLFVYTLPNVLIGELCIRHGMKGEAACFVFDIFDTEFQREYIQTLFDTNKLKCCVSGWADYMNGKAEAFFYLMEQGNEIEVGSFVANLNRIWTDKDVTD